MTFDPQSVRGLFPALKRSAIFLDGPAGSQVPNSVIEAISGYYRNHNANHGGEFATSRESDAMVEEVRRACADLLGTPDDDCIAFGANMTSLTFALSRALACTWNPGDEVLVTRLDHDANVSPWVRAAQDRGVTVQHVEIDPTDCTLDRDDFARKLSPRTKLVALGCVSNAVGTRNPFPEMIQQAHRFGALVFLDAVHHAPHLAMDVSAWDCDFLCCSAYKFFGPHVGILYGKRHLLNTLPAYKVRPCSESLPDRWMTGTQNFAAIAGVGAAIEYLAQIGHSLAVSTGRRASLLAALAVIEEYERELSGRLLAGLARVPGLEVRGITAESRLNERVPTVSFTMKGRTPRQVAAGLAERDIFSWHGNFYALPLTEALGLEPDGMLRVGALHYNTPAEIDTLIDALQSISADELQ